MDEQEELKKFPQWIQRLAAKGITPPAAFNYLQQAKEEALRRLLIQKDIIKKEEISELEDKVAEEFVSKIEKMPSLPHQ